MARTLGSDALLPEVNGRWPIVVLIFNLLLLGERVMGQACSIDLGADTTICQGQSVTLTAPPGYPDYLWSTGATTQSISVGSAGTFWGEASYTSPQLFVNSDFNAGATGFSTQFNQSTTLVTDGNYWIGTNAASYHPQFFGTGTGNFMIVNSGWPSALFNVYCQDVVVWPLCCNPPQAARHGVTLARCGCVLCAKALSVNCVSRRRLRASRPPKPLKHRT